MENETEQNLSMTELEEQLALPGGEALCKKILSQLNEIELRMRFQLQAGVPRNDYADWQAAADAVAAAQEVMQNVQKGKAATQNLP